MAPKSKEVRQTLETRIEWLLEHAQSLLSQAGKIEVETDAWAAEGLGSWKVRDFAVTDIELAATVARTSRKGSTGKILGAYIASIKALDQLRTLCPEVQTTASDDPKKQLAIVPFTAAKEHRVTWQLPWNFHVPRALRFVLNGLWSFMVLTTAIYALVYGGFWFVFTFSSPETWAAIIWRAFTFAPELLIAVTRDLGTTIASRMLGAFSIPSQSQPFASQNWEASVQSQTFNLLAPILTMSYVCFILMLVWLLLRQGYGQRLVCPF